MGYKTICKKIDKKVITVGHFIFPNNVTISYLRSATPSKILPHWVKIKGSWSAQHYTAVETAVTKNIAGNKVCCNWVKCCSAKEGAKENEIQAVWRQLDPLCLEEMETLGLGLLSLIRKQGVFTALGRPMDRAIVLENLGREPPSLSQKTENRLWIDLPSSQSHKTYHQIYKGVAKEEVN